MKVYVVQKGEWVNCYSYSGDPEICYVEHVCRSKETAMAKVEEIIKEAYDVYNAERYDGSPKITVDDDPIGFEKICLNKSGEESTRAWIEEWEVEE